MRIIKVLPGIDIPIEFVTPSSPPSIFNFIPYYGNGGNCHIVKWISIIIQYKMKF